jgi:hypothetical protein
VAYKKSNDAIIMKGRPHATKESCTIPTIPVKRAFLHDIVQAFVEIPFSLFLILIKVVRRSKIIQEWYDACIDLSIFTIQRVVQDPTIQEGIAATIAMGMNLFVQQPNLDQLLLHMVTCISKSQPDIARQQGQDFPIVVSSFVQGILQHASRKGKDSNSSSCNNHNNNAQNKDNNMNDETNPAHFPLRPSSQTESDTVKLENGNDKIDARPILEDSCAQVSMTDKSNETYTARNENAPCEDAIALSASSSSISSTTIALHRTDQERSDYVTIQPDMVGFDFIPSSPSTDAENERVTTSASSIPVSMIQCHNVQCRNNELLDSKREPMTTTLNQNLSFQNDAIVIEQPEQVLDNTKNSATQHGMPMFPFGIFGRSR